MSGSFGLPPITAYLSAVKNEQATAEKADKGDPSVELAVTHFTQAAATITSPAQLLSDYRALTVVLGAFGMSSMIGQTAVLRQLMTQDPTSSTSLATTSGNALWKRFAQQMSDWTAGNAPFSSPTAVSTIASQYLLSAYETDENKAVPGLGDALYFTRTSTGVSSITQLMADPTQLKVIEVANGIDPDQFGALDFDQQENILKGQVKLEDFKTSAGIQRIAEQYLALTAENPPSQAQSWDVTSLFSSQNNSPSIFDIIGQSLSTHV